MPPLPKGLIIANSLLDAGRAHHCEHTQVLGLIVAHVWGCKKASILLVCTGVLEGLSIPGDLSS